MVYSVGAVYLDIQINDFTRYWVGRDSLVGIATRYGLEGPEIESRRGRGFSHPSIPALGLTRPPA